MTELKPYSKYKDSGVEWIDKSPLNWIKAKIKYYATINGRIGYRGYTVDDIVDQGMGAITLSPSNIVNGKVIYSNPTYISWEKYFESPEIQVEEGYILFCKTGSTYGKVALVSELVEESTINPQLVIIKPNSNINNHYLYYFLYCVAGKHQIETIVGGSTMPTISQQSIENIMFYYPSLKEQERIVKYLNYKTSEIDSLISDKQHLIELLEEKRQAIITETVTKGLGPKVKMKDSGIEWIGEIPEHWEVVRLKNLLKLNPPKSEVNKDENIEVTFIPMEKLLSNGTVDYSLVRHISDVYNGYTYFKDNDIIMAKVTPCFENGNIALVKNLKNGIGFGTTELHVLRANKNIEAIYLYYLLLTEYFKQEGISTMYGVGGLKRIPSQFILDYKIGLPNKVEQRQILEYIEGINADINHLIKKQQKVIQKLQEYRESLIYEAVTGKIDLREYNENK